MENPFSGKLIPDDYDLTLLDRYGMLSNLESKCSGRTIMNYRYISPRGTGKSTLLERFFTPEKCQELAQKHKLVCFCRFSGDEMRTDEAVFVRLIEAVEETLLNLDPDSKEAEMFAAEFARLKQKSPDYTENTTKGEDVLKNMLLCLKKRCYFVTLVLDEFHQLACAKSLAESTFSRMASLGQRGLISYIVASDYDDEVGSETYYISPFTRIFNDAPSHLDGIRTRDGKRALMELVRSKLVGNDEVTFTDRELQIIFQITGGIPALVQNTLFDIFEIKQSLSDELDEEQIGRYALSACSPLMEKWVQYFDDDRWQTMQVVLDEVTESAIKDKLPKEHDKRSGLGQAGLITKNLRTQEYLPACPLFGQYICNELRRKLPTEVPQAPKVEQHIHINEGGTFINNEAGGTIEVTQNHLHQGISISEILSLLGKDNGDSRTGFALGLADRLRNLLPANGIPSLPRDKYTSDVEYEQVYDSEFEKYSQNMVQDIQVDEDQDLVVSQAELETLESRFEQARKRYRSNLSDEFLAKQSERCQFYIKLSVIVEDALELPGIQWDDYSPQLVLYGKALEQSLRDNFYKLFHQEETLSVYDTKHKVPDKKSEYAFATKPLLKTQIGNYAHLISDQSSYLATLCQKHHIQILNSSNDTHALTRWWQQLKSDIHEAREIRNKADHADPISPTRQDLNAICNYLFDAADGDGILTRCAVGKQLYIHVFPPAIDLAVIQKLLNQTCTIKCTMVKKNGGIQGISCEDGYRINVSPKRVQAFRTMNACEDLNLEGKELVVKVLEFNNQGDVETFGAEIVSVAN